MRVGVDGRSLVGGGARGVAHYTSALLGALAAGFPADEWRVLLPRGPVGALPPGLVPVHSALPSRVLFGAAALAGRPRLDRLLGADLDVLWTPAPAPVAVSAGVPVVVTVHDRSWEQRPDDFTVYERLWHRAARLRALVRGAERVVCVSQAVRQDLVAAWGLDPGRVCAIHSAPAVVGAVTRPRPGGGTAPPAAPAPRAARPFFLFVGALEPRKAPDLLLEAFVRARAAGLKADLRIVGDGRLSGRLLAHGAYRHGRVGDAELSGLYRDALALAFPSRLEGFGLPPVEALRAGTPVVASDLPVLREVLSDAGAMWVPPGDVAALAAALLRLEREPALRGRLVAAGRAATAELSWTATARATRAVLAEAAGLP